MKIEKCKFVGGRRWASGFLTGVAVLLVGEGVGALGAAGPADPPFTGNGICRFALHGFALAPQSESSINQAVQELIVKHESAFGFRRESGFRLQMRVYNRFEDFTNSTAMRGLTNFQGVYVPSTKEIVTFRQEIPGGLGGTLLHEASHAIMDHHFQRIQPWLSEGAADYFAFVLARNAATAQLLRQRLALLHLWMREDKLLDLKELLNADHERWRTMDQERAYAVSWSIVQFLMSSDSNRRVMNTLLWQWQEDPRRDLDCAGQVEAFYPGGFKNFETAWRRWLDPTGVAQVYKTSFRGDGVCQFAEHGYKLTAEVEATLNQQVGELLEKERGFFGFEPTPEFHLRIRIFGEIQDYARFSNQSKVFGSEMNSEQLARIDGYYSPLSREIVTLAPKAPEELTRRVLHLANTVILEEHFKKIPGWVLLGSPPYFVPTPGASGAQETLGAALQRAGIVTGRVPALKSFLDDAARPGENRNNAANNQTETICRALFEFFSSSEKNRRVLTTLLQDPQAGAAASNPARIDRYYPGGLAGLEADFKQWLAKLPASF